LFIESAPEGEIQYRGHSIRIHKAFDKMVVRSVLGYVAFVVVLGVVNKADANEENPPVKKKKGPKIDRRCWFDIDVDDEPLGRIMMGILLRSGN